MFEGVRPDNIVYDIIEKAKGIRHLLDQESTAVMNLQQAREEPYVQAMFALMQDSTKRKEAMRIFAKYKSRWEKVRDFISLLDRGRISGNFGTTHICVTCTQSVTFSHLLTCKTGMLGDYSFERAQEL